MLAGMCFGLSLEMVFDFFEFLIEYEELLMYRKAALNERLERILFKFDGFGFHLGSFVGQVIRLLFFRDFLPLIGSDSP